MNVAEANPSHLSMLLHQQETWSHISQLFLNAQTASVDELTKVSPRFFHFGKTFFRVLDEIGNPKFALFREQLSHGLILRQTSSL
jgi:hypothetical protein